MKTPKPIIIESVDRFHLDKPRYNGFQTGHGVHKSKKTYSRKPKHRYENGE